MAEQDGQSNTKRVEELMEARDELTSDIELLNEKLQNTTSASQIEKFRSRLDAKQNQLNDVENLLVEEIDVADKNVIENIGLDEDLSSIKQLEENVNNIQRKDREIDDKLDDLEEKQEKIESKEEKIEQLEESAEGLLERTTSSALGEQFADRKSELEETLKYWKYGSVMSILALIAVAGGMYYDISTSQASLNYNLSKIVLVIPISVAVWFTVSNYRRQKRLAEEYEFKARMALSLSGFRQVLKQDEVSEDSEVVANFVKETMEKIYSNPQKNVVNLNENGENDPVLDAQKPTVSLIDRLK